MFFDIAAIKKILSVENKNELSKDAKVNDQNIEIDNKEKMINDAMWVVNTAVYKFSTEYYYSHISKEDIFQVCCLGLVKAANLFDPNRGTKFTTFATICVQSEIYRELNKGYNKEKWNESLEEQEDQFEVSNSFTDDSEAEYHYTTQLELLKAEAKQGTIKRGIEIIQLKCENYSKSEIIKKLDITECIYKKRLLSARKYLKDSLT